jgi:predicted dehydrogenase
LEKGTVEDPAVTKESVHHFYKYVSGSILTRPPWFMDVTQEGEGIVDVTTHLVDLIQWECFPEQVIDYKKDIQLISTRRWPTDMTLSQFNAVTKLNDFPDYLKRNVVNDSVLKIYSNGEINYQLRGIHAKVSVTWAYKAPEGAGDTHYSIMRGTKSNLVIRQGADQNYKSALYIEPVNKPDTSTNCKMLSGKNVMASRFTCTGISRSF